MKKILATFLVIAVASAVTIGYADTLTDPIDTGDVLLESPVDEADVNFNIGANNKIDTCSVRLDQDIPAPASGKAPGFVECKLLDDTPTIIAKGFVHLNSGYIASNSLSVPVTYVDRPDLFSLCPEAESDPDGPPDPSCVDIVKIIVTGPQVTLSGTGSSNLVANGGFESPIVTQSAGWDIFDSSSLPGWTVSWIGSNPCLSGEPGFTTTGMLELQDGTGSTAGLGGAFAGDQYAELDSDCNGPNPNSRSGEAASVRIFQDLSTDAGESYELSFAYRKRPGTSDSTNGLTVKFDGSDVVTNLSAPTDWTVFTFSVTASGSTATLEFKDTGTSDSLGTFVDRVRVDRAAMAISFAFDLDENTLTDCLIEIDKDLVSGTEIQCDITDDVGAVIATGNLTLASNKSAFTVVTVPVNPDPDIQDVDDVRVVITPPEVEEELLAKVNTFNAKEGTGHQSVTGVGFQPKVVFFWITDLEYDGTDRFGRFGRGWTDGTNEGTVATAWQDSAGASKSKSRIVNNKSITLINQGGSVLAEAKIVSLDADGFTLNWTNSGNNRLVSFLALGGNTLQAKAGSFIYPKTFSPFSITGVGFQPDAILLMGIERENDFDGNNNRGGHGFGIGISDTDRHSDGHRWRNNKVGSDSASSGLNANFVLAPANDFSTPSVAYDLVSLDANGFTLIKDIDPGNKRTTAVIYLALEGLNVARGTITQPTSTGNQSVSGLSFEPAAVLFDGGDKATVDGYEPKAEMVAGAANGSTMQAALWIGSNSLTNPYPSDSAHSSERVIISYTTKTSGAPTLNAQASFVSMDSGGFTINWITADSIERYIGWIAFG